MNERRVAGVIMLVLGGLALVEARRLAALREEMVAGAVVGDDTLPWIIGAALVALGLHALFLARWTASRVQFPAGDARRQFLASAGSLAVYCIVTPYLGYTLTTLAVASGLYRAMGGYRWPLALLFGVLTAGVLYLLFRVWLLEPLPLGRVGF